MKNDKVSSKGQLAIQEPLGDALHLPPKAESGICASGTSLSINSNSVFPKTKPNEVRGVLFQKARQAFRNEDIAKRLTTKATANDIASKR